MTMKFPPHPGMGLKEDFEAVGVSVSEAAAKLGVTRQYLQAVTWGKSAMTPDTALRLEKVMGSSAEHWLKLQLAHDLALARLNHGKLKLKRLAPRVP